MKGNKSKANVAKDLALAIQYFLGLGLKENEAKELLQKSGVRDLDIIQIRLDDYQKIFQVDLSTILRWMLKDPKLLGLETVGKQSTTVQSKLKQLQEVLRVDEKTASTMILQVPKLLDLSSNTIKSKIADYQKLLHTDAATITKWVCCQPYVLNYHVTENVAATVNFYLDELKINTATLLQMLLSFPALITYGIDDSATSIKTKIQKINEVLPREQARELMIEKPMILTAPAQSFKIRYMLAAVIGLLSNFINNFIFSEGKVYARYCYLTQKHPTAMKRSLVYASEKKFNQYAGAKTVDLLEMFPLDLAAVKKIEHLFFKLTGQQIELDNQELQALGLQKIDQLKTL